MPPISACDGSYRIFSPAPIATARGTFTSIQLYPRRFVTVSIAVDFPQAASVAHSLERPTGEPVPFEEAAMLSTTGSYVFKSRVVLLSGAVREDRVAFNVK